MVRVSRGELDSIHLVHTGLVVKRGNYYPLSDLNIFAARQMGLGKRLATHELRLERVPRTNFDANEVFDLVQTRRRSKAGYRVERKCRFDAR